uniref:Fucolectin tachylectin-4 pentraxin-1 domain-containing protein n=1 Tax=Sinocyclocheilus rhinocerous TaxID=307959 RepID=A0A673HFX1_9TELE
ANLTLIYLIIIYKGLYNLATGRNVTQSSNFGAWFAEQAIDFNPGLTKSYSACSSTSAQTNSWWRVDLSSVYRVSRVVVTNRLDCCPERINGAEIRIGNSLENNGNNHPICAVISSIPAGVSFTYICNDMEGRYVNLFIPGDKRFLTVCEVEVYGVASGSAPTANTALWRIASQSSQLEDWISRNTVDGLRDSCSHTNPQTDPWWKVDLLNEYKVNRVAITNRLSKYYYRINGAVIRITDVLSVCRCAVVSTIPSGATANFSCGGIEGRYVTVHIPGDLKILTLCEVEVYGDLIGKSLL